MIKTIWYMYKPGDQRDYAMTTPPSQVWAQRMKEEGFKLFECLVEIPHEVELEGHGDQLSEGVIEVTPIGEQSQTSHCAFCGAYTPTTSVQPLCFHRVDCPVRLGKVTLTFE